MGEFLLSRAAFIAPRSHNETVDAADLAQLIVSAQFRDVCRTGAGKYRNGAVVPGLSACESIGGGITRIASPALQNARARVAFPIQPNRRGSG
jgi:hypothetical protein